MPTPNDCILQSYVYRHFIEYLIHSCAFLKHNIHVECTVLVRQTAIEATNHLTPSEFRRDLNLTSEN